MRLKRVKVFGFKTFADRTEFDLDGSVVAVVGPNGCGKSNLVDAILWGLGEGNARQLRAQSGQDVIFSGSSHRKPLGFAEVTLLFDNEDGGLPIDAPEVSITRRLTRGGEADYAINRQPCRQRDVYDLLADSGLGRAGYAIVGQKEIDQAVAASPHERRAWVDEAAGVQRYRARKIESERRLASAELHLTRVCDILTELGAQREPLREEAEIARRYKVALDSLRAVESGLLIREVAQAVRDSADLEARIAESMRLSRQESSALENAESELRTVGTRLGEADRQIETARLAAQVEGAKQDRAASDLRLVEQRLASLDEIERTLGDERAAWVERIAEARTEAAGLEAEVRQESEALDRIRTDCSSADSESKELAAQLAAIDGALAAARESQVRQMKLDAERAHRNERAMQAKRELVGIDKALPELSAAVVEARVACDEAAATVAGGHTELQKLQTQLNELTEEQDRDANFARKMLADRSGLDGRRRGVEATIAQHEGLNQGARAVLEAREKGQLSGVYVPVGEAIETSREHAVAIETALGGSANDLIVETEAVAKAAIDWLKQARCGRATFQPIPLMRPRELDPEARTLIGSKGVVGRACELVKCAPAHRLVIESLLGRVLVVHDLDTALRIARSSGWNRLVTLDGDVVHHSGSVTGGNSGRQTYGLVQRKADVADIGRQIEALDRELAELERCASTRQKARDEATSKIREIQESARILREEADDTRGYWQQLAEELGSAEKARHRLTNELERLASQTETIEPVADVAALEAERDAKLKALATRSSDSDQAEERLKAADSRFKQAELRHELALKRLAVAEDAERSRERKLTHLEPERTRHRADIERLRSEIASAEAAKLAAETRFESLKAQKNELTVRTAELTEAARSCRDNLAAVGDALHQSELGRARCEAKRAVAAQRLLEEYGLTEDDATERDPTVETPPDGAALVTRLRRDLRGMGDVNLGAIEAFDRLSTRYDELDIQREDIVAGIDEVQKSIVELDKLTRDRFLATFEQLQSHFDVVFKKLFPGGVGRLSLMEGESTLETGIEIEVTLPGKKRQRLDLLSGGERALCAAAFLFSLLRVKPSPLVVLDEVDAPLDGSNVERFAELLAEFTDHIQFLLITHNQTTIAAAPIWLGVTMNEPGVSTLVPMRVPERALPQSAAVMM